MKLSASKSETAHKADFFFWFIWGTETWGPDIAKIAGFSEHPFCMLKKPAVCLTALEACAKPVRLISCMTPAAD